MKVLKYQYMGAPHKFDKGSKVKLAQPLIVARPPSFWQYKWGNIPFSAGYPFTIIGHDWRRFTEQPIYDLENLSGNIVLEGIPEDMLEAF